MEMTFMKKKQNPAGPELLLILPFILVMAFISNKDKNSQKTPSAAPANTNASSSSKASNKPAATGDISAMWLKNSNIVAQMVDWIRARIANGEDPSNWAAFRQHEINMGNPDPGPNPPPQFFNS
jgi:hypothetical protein